MFQTAMFMNTYEKLYLNENLFYIYLFCVYKCFACMYVCEPHVCLVQKIGTWLVELELQMLVSHDMSVRNNPGPLKERQVFLWMNSLPHRLTHLMLIWPRLLENGIFLELGRYRCLLVASLSNLKSVPGADRMERTDSLKLSSWLLSACFSIHIPPQQ